MDIHTGGFEYLERVRACVAAGSWEAGGCSLEGRAADEGKKRASSISSSGQMLRLLESSQIPRAFNKPLCGSSCDFLLTCVSVVAKRMPCFLR